MRATADPLCLCGRPSSCWQAGAALAADGDAGGRTLRAGRRSGRRGGRRSSTATRLTLTDGRTVHIAGIEAVKPASDDGRRRPWRRRRGSEIARLVAGDAGVRVAVAGGAGPLRPAACRCVACRRALGRRDPGHSGACPRAPVPGRKTLSCQPVGGRGRRPRGGAGGCGRWPLSPSAGPMILRFWREAAYMNWSRAGSRRSVTGRAWFSSISDGTTGVISRSWCRRRGRCVAAAGGCAQRPAGPGSRSDRGKRRSGHPAGRAGRDRVAGRGLGRCGQSRSRAGGTRSAGVAGGAGRGCSPAVALGRLQRAHRRRQPDRRDLRRRRHAGRQQRRQPGALAHRRRLWRHLPRRQGRADAGADRQPHRGRLGPARPALPDHHPQRAGGQRLRAPRRLSLRHARACWRWPTIPPRSRRCSPTRWATSPPITPPQRQQKARDALIVSRVVTDVLDNDEGGQLALASSQRTLAAFSQQQELEADAIGVKTIGKAGYDPFAAARFLERDGDNTPTTATSLTLRDQRPDFLATHPSTPERVDFATRRRAQFGAPGIGDGRSRPLPRRHRRHGVRRRPDQGFVRDRTFVHPGLGIGFTVPEGFVIDNTSEAVLATGADGTALRFDAVGLAQGHRPRRLSQVGLGQRARRGQRAQLLGQRLAGRLGDRPRPRAGISRSPSSRPAAAPPTASSSPTRRRHRRLHARRRPTRSTASAR